MAKALNYFVQQSEVQQPGIYMEEIVIPTTALDGFLIKDDI
jgi:hypothetical protein